MLHGGEIYDKEIELDFSVSLNPCGCPDEVKRALSGAICDVDKYPDMNQRKFREAVARAESGLISRSVSNAGSADEILPDNIIGGNGASELLAAIVNMLRPKKALLPVPSFYGYVHALEMVKECKVVTYKLEDKEFELDEEFADEITGDIDLVILGNPNNPTGKCIKKEALEAVLKKCRETGSALVVDECFFRLSDQGNNREMHTSAGDDQVVSARTYLGSYDNLYVVDAYTKLFSIPGVRVGFCLSQPENIERLRKFLPEWNMSAFAQDAGIACAEVISEACDSRDASNEAVKDISKDFMNSTFDLIKTEREYLASELRKLRLQVFESDTNFLLIRIPENYENIFTLLLSNHILIRNCSNFDGLKNGFYRIAVKDHESNKRLTDALSEAFS